MHKSQVLLYLLAAFITGVFVSSFLAVSPAGTMLLLMFGVAVLAISAYHKTFGPTAAGIRRRKLGFVAGCLILSFTLGVWRFNSFNSDHSYLLQFAGRTAGDKEVNVTLRGYVDGDFSKSASSGRFPFRVKRIVAGQYSLKADERILVSTAAFPRYGYGELLVLAGSVALPQNFNDFDYAAYLKKDGIRTVMRNPEIKADERNLPLPWSERLKVAAYRRIFRLKDAFTASVNKSVPEPAASYLNGILVGSQQNIPDQVKESFRLTGTTHILAISGYNISIIAQVLLWLLVFAFRRRTAFWISAGVVVAFTILTGASASVVRAAVMGLLVGFAGGYGRIYEIKNTVILAGAVMIFANPLALRFDAGFQLSFLSVLGIIYIQPLLQRAFRRLNDYGGAKEIITTTLSAQLAVLPLALYYFRTFPVLALPANILVLPLVPIAMLLGFAAGASGLVSVLLGRIAGWAAWTVAEYQLGIIRWFSHLPFASLSVPLSRGGFIILSAGGAGLVAWLTRRYADNRAG